MLYFSVLKRKFTADLSAYSLQVILYQLTGILIFYFCSKFLGKDDFGEINWSVALLYTSFTILGFGIDQVIIQKVAAGDPAASLLKLYIFHVLLTGIILYLILYLGAAIFPSFYARHDLLLALGLSQFFLFLSTPFKQMASGREQFKDLLWMSTCSNIVKAAGVILLASIHRLTIGPVIVLFIAGAALELLLSILLSRGLFAHAMTTVFDGKRYGSLIRESLPQLGSTLFNSALARFDWILLGFLSTAAVLAEYSFAYKVFEIATLPLLILGPLLLPKMTRLIHQPRREGGFFPPRLEGAFFSRDAELRVLLRLEMILSCLIALLVNMLWDPFIDRVTGGKYGLVNDRNILLLSCCMPFLYLTNFCWTLLFSSKRLKEVFVLSMITFLINMTADIVLIPFLKGLGAAIGYLAAILVQSILYTRMARRKIEFAGAGLFKKAWLSLLFCLVSAMTSGWLVHHLVLDPIVRAVFSLCLYLMLLTIAGQLRLADWKTLKSALGL